MPKINISLSAVAVSSIVTGNLSAITISATNYLNLPAAQGGASIHQTALLESDKTNNTATGQEVTGLSVSLTGAGTYSFEYNLICQSTATGTGLKFGVNYTGTSTRFLAILQYVGTGGAASTGIADDVAATLTGQIVEGAAAKALATTAPNLGPHTGVAAANSDIFYIIKGIIQVTTAGDLELWHASEGAVTTSVESGSCVIVRKVS